MLCGHYGRKTNQNSVAVEVYDDGKRLATNQQKGAVAAENSSEKCVAA
jgi:hypothetical protein